MSMADPSSDPAVICAGDATKGKASPRVRIVNRKHPHFGEYGLFTGQTIRLVTGSTMALVKLEHCKHGGDACYVSPGDIREVNAEDQYV